MLVHLPSLDAAVVLAIIAVVMVLFLSEWVRIDVVAVLVLALLGIAHVLPFHDLFSGFSSTAVIALLSIMILSAGLERAGLMQVLSNLIVRYGDKSESRLMLLICLSAGVIASFLQNFGAVVLFLPIIHRVSLRTAIDKSKLLMPMSFCAILGSTTTIIGSSPMILLNDLLANADISPQRTLKFFTPLPVGLSLLSVGILFFLTFGKKIIAKLAKTEETSNNQYSYFQRVYGVGGELSELKITAQTPFVDRSLRHMEDVLPNGLTVVAVYQNGQSEMPPLRRQKLSTDTVVAVMGDKALVKQFAEEFNLTFHKERKVFSELLNPAQSGLSEVVIPPHSTLIGTDYRHLHMRRNHEMQVLSVLRGDTVRKGGELREIVVRAGDTLSIFSRWERLQSLEQNRDFVVLTADYPRDKVKKKKLPYALGCLLLSLIIIVIAHTSVAFGLFVGAVAMMYSGVLTIDEAYEAISWKTIFLMAGLIPLGIAAQKTGAANWLAHFLYLISGKHSILFLQFCFAILATLFTLVVSNVGATIILVPISIHFAKTIGADPYLFALTVALACNNAFLLPTHQANALIAGAGKYQNKDFLKVGSIVSVLFLIVMVGVLHWYWAWF